MKENIKVLAAKLQEYFVGNEGDVNPSEYDQTQSALESTVGVCRVLGDRSDIMSVIDTLKVAGYDLQRLNNICMELCNSILEEESNG